MHCIESSKESYYEKILIWKGLFRKRRQPFSKSIQKAKELYKKRKKKKFNNLSSKFVSDNKLFWNTVKVLFSNIDTNNANIKLTEKMKLFMTK